MIGLGSDKDRNKRTQNFDKLSMSCCLCASQFMASPLNHTLSDFGQGPFRPLTSFPKKCPSAKKYFDHKFSVAKELFKETVLGKKNI